MDHKLVSSASCCNNVTVNHSIYVPSGTSESAPVTEGQVGGSQWNRVQVSIFTITSFQVFQGPTEINMFTYTGWSWEGRKALLSHRILRGYRLKYVKCTPHRLLLTLQESGLFPCSLPSAHIWLHCPILTPQRWLSHLFWKRKEMMWVNPRVFGALAG